MKISYQVIECNKIDKHLMEEFIHLEQKFFDLKREDILKSISQKDLLYAFYNNDEHKLIGTLAIKWIFFQDSVIIYLGNGAVDPDYQRHNFSNTVLFNSYLRTVWKFPGKKVCFACFMGTPKAYNIAQRYPYHFPQKGVKTSTFTKNIMKIVAETIAEEGNYEEEDDIFLLTIYKKKNLIREETISGVVSYDGYYEEVNPRFKDGKQLLMVFMVDIEAFFKAGKYTLQYYIRKSIARFK
ncbi:MAG: hypothetical protein BGO76_06850 [Caedibacter sp. 38-128]|nr:hypothetical protein [Holosporales bacterium]OJX03850.1 MAG: hypothetical protein BGO76_06850 [Caedibacter sp. 38-128]